MTQKDHDSVDHMAHPSRTSRKAAICLAALLFTSAGRAQEIEVTGQLKVEAYFERNGELVRVVGQLSDELGEPVEGRVSLHEAQGTGAPLEVEPCGSSSARDEVETGGSGEEGLATSSLGHFCVMVATKVDQITVVAEAEHFPEESTLAHNDNLVLHTPRFREAPAFLDKHDPKPAMVEVLSTSMSASAQRKTQLVLSMRCGSDTRDLGSLDLGSTELEGSRLSRFEVRASNWMLPGTCELKATLSSAGAASVSTTQTLTIRDQLPLLVEHRRAAADRATLVIGVPSGSRATGIIEASTAGMALASVPLSEDGDATFDFELGNEATSISFSFVPNEPHWVPASALVVGLPPRESANRLWPFHLVAFAAFVTWLVYKWFWSSRPTRRDEVEATYRVEPSVQFLKSDDDRLRGSVRDCHTGEPLVGAVLTLSQLTIEKSSQSGNEEDVATTDEQGEFFFDKRFEKSKLLAILCSHPGYLSLRSRVEGPQIMLQLEATRRAALDRLLSWTRSAGAPWNVASRPTVGQIQRLAAAENRGDVARWTEEVAGVAYGPELPREVDLEKLGHYPRRSSE